MAGQTCYARHRPFPQKYGRNTPDMPAGQVPLCPYLPFLWQPVITGLAVSSNYTAMPHALAERHGVVRLKSIPALWQQSCYEAVTPFRRRPGHGHTFRPAASASVLKSGPAARRRSTAHPASSYTVLIDPSIILSYPHFCPSALPGGYFLQKKCRLVCKWQARTRCFYGKSSSRTSFRSVFPLTCLPYCRRHSEKAKNIPWAS